MPDQSLPRPQAPLGPRSPSQTRGLSRAVGQLHGPGERTMVNAWLADVPGFHGRDDYMRHRAADMEWAAHHRSPDSAQTYRVNRGAAHPLNGHYR